ncbi:MAG: MBL fold metallo-hydrolase [Bacilli bacterium]
MGFEKINKGLYILKIPFANIYVAIYLLINKKKILIDSGLSSDNITTYLLPALKELGLDILDIDILTQTHTHADHIGGHYKIKELNPNIKVYAIKESIDKINNPLFYNTEIRKVFPFDSPSPNYELKGIPVDYVLKDNEIIDDKIKVIYTPGHDDDCVSFLDMESNILLTGDSIQQHGTDTQGMALYMYIDSYIETLNKLKTLHLDGIISGHPFNPYNEYILGKENVNNFIDFNLKIVDEYNEIIKENITLDIHDLVKMIIKHNNKQIPNYLFLGLYTVSQHLEYIKKKEGEKR